MNTLHQSSSNSSVQEELFTEPETAVMHGEEERAVEREVLAEENSAPRREPALRRSTLYPKRESGVRKMLALFDIGDMRRRLYGQRSATTREHVLCGLLRDSDRVLRDHYQIGHRVVVTRDPAHKPEFLRYRNFVRDCTCWRMCTATDCPGVDLGEPVRSVMEQFIVNHGSRLWGAGPRTLFLITNRQGLGRAAYEFLDRGGRLILGCFRDRVPADMRMVADEFSDRFRVLDLQNHLGLLPGVTLMREPEEADYRNPLRE